MGPLGPTRKLKGVFRRYQSQPVAQVIYLINPLLRGRVNYFAVGKPRRVLQLHSRLGRKEGSVAYASGFGRKGFG
jgi:RNA-directed DNA polymerase